jgi:hypothetical protein
MKKLTRIQKAGMLVALASVFLDAAFAMLKAEAKKERLVNGQE